MSVHTPFDDMSTARPVPQVLAVAGTVLEHMGAGLCRAFECADEALFDLACAASNDQGQHRYFDGMRQLRMGKDAVLGRFRACVLKAWRVQSAMRAAGARQAWAAQAMALELVSEEELEQRLAIDGIVARCEVSMGQSIANLQVALTASVGRGLNAVDCAIGPRGLAEAMREALDLVDVSLSVRLVLLQYFEHEALGALPEAYKRASQALSNGRPAVSRPASDGLRRATPALCGAPPDGGRATSRTATAPAPAEHASVAPMLAPCPGTPVNPPEAMASHRQGARPNADSGMTGEASVNVSTNRALAAADAVQRLFDSSGMVLDRAPELEAAIRRLQVPIVRVALQQPELFDDAGHPVRRFLAQLARWTRRWGRHPPSDAILLDRLDAVHTLAGGELGTRLDYFDREAVFMQRAAADQLRRAQLVERRGREAERGKARLAEAERRVAELVSGWPELLKLPPELSELALGRWPRYLVLLSLRHGQAGSPWRDAVSMLAELAAAVVGRGPQALDAVVLTRGVIATGGHHDEVEQYLRVFKSWRAQSAMGNGCAKGRQPRQVLAPDSHPPARNSGTSPATDADALALVRGDECGLTLSELRPGRVFDLVQDDGRQCRVKLSWIGRQGTHYLFVDGRGLRCVELDRESVLAMLAAGRIAPADANLSSEPAAGAA